MKRNILKIMLFVPIIMILFGCGTKFLETEYHKGIDVATQYGTPCYSVYDGEVLYAGSADGFGKWVVVRQTDGTVATYGHVSDIYVKPGDKVSAGQRICNTGNAGVGGQPHLHFQLNTGTDYDRSTTFDPCAEKLVGQDEAVVI